MSMFIMAAVVGVTAGLSPGPLLALVITQTVRYGPREGARVAFAPLITDVPIVLAALFTLDSARQYGIVFDLISLGGGAYVLYLAWETVRSAGVDVQIADDTPPHSLRRGVLVNALSPHPYLFWVTAGAFMFATAAKAGLIVGVMVIVVFEAGLVGSKIAVANLVGYSRDILTGKVYTYILRTLGILLALFALRMIVGALQSLW
ncbi:MAG: LysE family translocator [Candidatus Hydrogenedentes bacterium]|nr:LysE family translocator [Candidatus Hydrogenedentota bacterium]